MPLDRRRLFAEAHKHEMVQVFLADGRWHKDIWLADVGPDGITVEERHAWGVREIPWDQVLVIAVVDDGEDS